LFAITLAGLLGSGRGDSGQNRTIHGLQEENKVLKGKIDDMEKQLVTLKAENEASQATRAKELEDRLVRDHQGHV
jgi:hypothetical protein